VRKFSTVFAISIWVLCFYSSLQAAEECDPFETRLATGECVQCPENPRCPGNPRGVADPRGPGGLGPR
jgi:hypothetical protein